MTMASGLKMLSSTEHALASYCSIRSPNELVDTTIFRARDVSIGAFRCPVTYASFRDTGPIERHIIVFPRTGVWIQHEGARRFLADPSVVTIYNAAQRYERFPESPAGDNCDWFGVSDALAREIVRHFDQGAAESDRPFTFAWAPSSARVYARQRLLLHRALANELDSLGGEEAVIELIATVIGSAYGASPRPRGQRRAAVQRRHDLAAAARAELLRTFTDNRSVTEIAVSIGSSPFHLCRVFRACTGRTLHEYRNELRIRAALDSLADPARATNLSAIAHDLGFASHSHFVRAMRRATDFTPSALRAELSGT